ncbi:MAG TPA: hypothetical protein VM051_12915 [Usitatibacter sp.]|nr:hypothetical protein [Usitatibacter sp.]
MQRHDATPRQRRNAVITALVLGAMALGIYLTLIAKFVVYG